MRKAVLRTERGFALAYVVLVLLAVCAVTALAVDIARTSFTASEVQSAADLAATAAATKLMTGGTTAQAQADADTTVSKNTIDGHVAASVPITFGNVNQAGTFTANGNPLNAAKATATKSVTNLLAGMMNADTSTIQKTAIATMATISNGSPELPIVLSASCFDNAHDCTADANACPLTTTANNSACWTGFKSGHSDNTVDGLLPTTGGCAGGGGTPAGLINVGDSIDVTNGTSSNIYKHLFCDWCANPNKEYLVAVVNNGACGNPGGCNGNQPVAGFATIKIKRFLKGSPPTPMLCGDKNPPQVIELQSFRNAEEPGGTGGCATCGTGFIRLVG
jgi:hypothetical protein